MSVSMGIFYLGDEFLGLFVSVVSTIILFLLCITGGMRRDGRPSSTALRDHLWSTKRIAFLTSQTNNCTCA